MSGSAKRPRASSSGTAPEADGFLRGIKVFVPSTGIPFLAFKLKVWKQAVPRHGGSLTQDPAEPGITHVLVGSGGVSSLPRQLQPKPPSQPRPATPAAAQGPSTSINDAARGAASGGAAAAAAAAAGAAPEHASGGTRGGRAGQAAGEAGQEPKQRPGSAASQAHSVGGSASAGAVEWRSHAATAVAAAPAAALLPPAIRAIVGAGEGGKKETRAQGEEAGPASPRSPAAPLTPPATKQQPPQPGAAPPSRQGPAAGAQALPMAPRPIERLPDPGPGPGLSLSQPGTATCPSAPLRPRDGATSSRSGSGASRRGQKRQLPSVGDERQAPACVDFTWLERCLAARRVLEESEFPPAAPQAASGPSHASTRGAESLSSSGLSGQALLHQRWLGQYWHAGCEDMSLTELVLQNVYSEERSCAIGNEGVVEALAELARYERALQEDYFDDPRKGGEKVVNHRSLRYSRAAAVVRGCAYRLAAPVQAGQLPFVGPATARQIDEILGRGSCATLDAFRADVEVTDSRGVLRRGTGGGRARALFTSLPGVGQPTAKLWWDLGIRSVEALEAAAEPGGVLSPDGAYPLTVDQRFSLRHRADLLEGTSPAEVEEMRGVVVTALEAVSYPGWRVELVGGGARSTAVHDTDLLATHPSGDIEGVVHLLRDHLESQGRLVPPGQGMCRVQAGNLPNHLDKLRAEHLAEPSAAPSYQTLDRFDHIYGVYNTLGSKVRRLDIIIAPANEWAFALVGWIGSRQFLRFMRGHAKDLGMFLTSHCLLRKVGSQSLLVPQEKPPTDRAGQERWPPGWGPGRRVETERDVFELLGLPYREPSERNCP